jgi:hypothetical protein
MLSRMVKPETERVSATPGVSRAIFSMRAITSWVRCTLADSGSCTFTSR